MTLKWHDDPDVQAFGRMMQHTLMLGCIKLGANKALAVALGTIVGEMERMGQHVSKDGFARLLHSLANGVRDFEPEDGA